MGSASEARYCARGKQCVQYDPKTGKPEKLSRYNSDDICHHCQREEVDGDQVGLPTYDGAPYYRLFEEGPKGKPVDKSSEAAYKELLGVDRLRLHKSHAAGKLAQLVKGLILDLHFENGPYWEAIQDLRVRWCISPQVGIPSQDWQTYLHPPGSSKETSTEDWIKLVRQWGRDIRAIYVRFIPARFRVPPWGQSRWSDFVARCALYQPPADDLLGFYLSCGAVPLLALPTGWEKAKEDELVVMLEAPIERLRDADRVEAAWEGYYEALIRDISERLKPLGIEIEKIISESPRAQEALEELTEKLEAIRKDSCQYIRVDEYTAWEDLGKAYEVLVHSQEERPKAGPPTRDPLIAVQYAYLHEERGWTAKQIAERYEGRTDEQFLKRIGAAIKAGKDIKKSRAKNNS